MVEVVVVVVVVVIIVFVVDVVLVTNAQETVANSYNMLNL